MEFYRILILASPILLIAAIFFGGRFLSSRMTSSRFNSTSDWTPAPEHEVEMPSAGTILTPYDLQLITRYLETGESLEGFARALFSPARPQDWKFGSGIEKLPLLIAATSGRILLFEVTLLTVHRYRFIPNEDIQYLRPPKRGFWGTSGRTRIGLKSGHEYQMGFLGPLLNEEGMRQEQRLAAYLRRLAPRFAPSREQGAPTHQAAA